MISRWLLLSGVFNEIFGVRSNAEIHRNPANHLKSGCFLSNTLFPYLRRLPSTVQAHVNLGSSKKSLLCFLSYICTLPGVTIRRKLYMHFLQGEQILEYERRRTVAASMNFIYSVFLTVTRLLLSCWMIDSPLWITQPVWRIDLLHIRERNADIL